MSNLTTTRQIRLERRLASYWRVSFDHSPLNIFGPETVPQLEDIIKSLESDERVKVVVFDTTSANLEPDGETGRQEMKMSDYSQRLVGVLRLKNNQQNEQNMKRTLQVFKPARRVIVMWSENPPFHPRFNPSLIPNCEARPKTPNSRWGEEPGR